MVYLKVSTNSQNFRQNVQISYHSVNLLSGNEGVKFSEQGHQCFFLRVARFQRSHRYTDGISEWSFSLILSVPISYPISLTSGWLDPGNEVVFFRVSGFSYFLITAPFHSIRQFFLNSLVNFALKSVKRL